MIKLSKPNWAEFWIVVYLFSIILVPGIEIGSKRVFLQEGLLIPIFFLALCNIRETKPPLSLIVLYVAFLFAFCSGSVRGNIANTFNFYTIYHTDFFDFGQELTRLIRWCLLFSIPWMLSTTPISAPRNLKFLFQWGTIFGVISAALTLCDKFGLVQLTSLGYLNSNSEWAERSMSTFVGPQEAGMFFGMLALFQIQGLATEKLSARVVLAILFLAAAYTTHTATAYVSLIAALVLPYFMRQTQQTKWYLLIIVATAVILLNLVPEHLLQHKINNFGYRTKIWNQWFEIIQVEPRVLFFGIGLANAVTDNSFFFLLIKTGLCGTIAFFYFVSQILRNIPQHYYSVVIFWICSWLALDTLGFWGVGRFYWLFLAFFWHPPAKDELPIKVTDASVA